MRRRFHRLRRACIALQCALRAKLASRVLKKKKAEAKDLGHLQQSNVALKVGDTGLWHILFVGRRRSLGVCVCESVCVALFSLWQMIHLHSTVQLYVKMMLFLFIVLHRRRSMSCVPVLQRRPNDCRKRWRRRPSRLGRKNWGAW